MTSSRPWCWCSPVMFLFLQNVRYTLIPSIVVPVCLLGTLTFMYLLGFR
ncbi:efflux RND transporter permease subunit [Klebsiella pneumoniae]|nr:efflux RND transporter permease subunit [Klebsiella pneumoniae]